MSFIACLPNDTENPLYVAIADVSASELNMENFCFFYAFKVQGRRPQKVFVNLAYSQPVSSWICAISSSRSSRDDLLPIIEMFNALEVAENW